MREGAIQVDGTDIRGAQRNSLRRMLGIVLQDSFLFSDTVMQNIRYGRLEASDDEVIHAAKLANADSFIRHLPHGYQTMLSERGSNLSQGQRQMISIARAILADPRILILDEATSSVDTRTEVHIQEAMLRLMEGRTSFVIAHRLSTIRGADEILVIDQGRIIERGTHRELLARTVFTSACMPASSAGRCRWFRWLPVVDAFSVCAQRTNTTTSYYQVNAHRSIKSMRKNRSKISPGSRISRPN